MPVPKQRQDANINMSLWRRGTSSCQSLGQHPQCNHFFPRATSCNEDTWLQQMPPSTSALQLDSSVSSWESTRELRAKFSWLIFLFPANIAAAHLLLLFAWSVVLWGIRLYSSCVISGVPMLLNQDGTCSTDAVACMDAISIKMPSCQHCLCLGRWGIK